MLYFQNLLKLWKQKDPAQQNGQSC